MRWYSDRRKGFKSAAEERRFCSRRANKRERLRMARSGESGDEAYVVSVMFFGPARLVWRRWEEGERVGHAILLASGDGVPVDRLTQPDR